MTELSEATVSIYSIGSKLLLVTEIPIFTFLFSHDYGPSTVGSHSSLENLITDVYKAADGFGLLQDATGKYMLPEDFLGVEPLTNHYVHDPTQSLSFLLR